MDIITHGLTGIALSTTIAAYPTISWKSKIWIGIAGGFGGIFPDVDVISLWGGFDQTFGQWFNLQQSGREIFGATHWYSHHVFTHSLAGALCFAFIGCLIYLLYTRFTKGKNTASLKWYTPAFVLGYLGHLFEDMITPGGPWNGISFFWPSSHFSGGWGKVWWWNNYDLFLIVVVALLINLTFIIFRFKAILLTRLTILTAIVLFVIQTERRNHDFNTKGNKEEISLNLQKQYLGDTLYHMIKKLDNIIPVAF